LYKMGILVQMRWTRCNKTNNFQCCQYHALIRILPGEANGVFQDARYLIDFITTISEISSRFGAFECDPGADSNS
jgi:hypothetical protein